MPYLDLAVLCETAIIDQATNNLSVVNQIEQVNLPQFPAVLPRIMVVTTWQRESEIEESFTERISITGPSGKGLAKVEIPIRMERRRHRHLSAFANLMIETPGDYTFDIAVRPDNASTWTTRRTIILDVQKVDEPTPEEAAH